MIRAAFLLAMVVMLVAAARSFLPQETLLVGSGATLAFGFVLLAALQSGTLFSGLRMPRLTGYLVCGFLAGPSITNLVTERMLGDLKLVNGVAIGLIALSAGGELSFRRIRGRLLAILATGGGALIVAVVVISIAVLAVSPLLGFMGEMSWPQRAVVALTMGVVFSALSPTVTLALISETGAAGPISEMSLGIVVVGDLVIVVAFAAVNALASSTFGHEDAGGMSALLWHLFGSIGGGVLLALVLFVYLKLVNLRVPLFVFGMCFLCAEAGTRLNLDPLLVCLTAGLFLENLTDIQGDKLVPRDPAGRDADLRRVLRRRRRGASLGRLQARGTGGGRSGPRARGGALRRRPSGDGRVTRCAGRAQVAALCPLLAIGRRHRPGRPAEGPLRRLGRAGERVPSGGGDGQRDGRPAPLQNGSDAERRGRHACRSSCRALKSSLA